jgi:hypothetical protein
LRVQADEDAFGALEARATARVAHGLETVAQTAQKVDDEFNEANARELDAEFRARTRDRLYNPETGYLSTARGAGALERRQEIETGIQQDLDEIVSRARSPRAAALARQALSQHATDTLNSVATHLARESNTYQNEQSEARILEAQSGAVAAWGDEAAVRANIATAIGEAQNVARRNGWSPEQTQARVRAIQSGIYTSVIQQMAVSSPTEAEALFERIRPSLDAQAAGELRTTMRAAQREYIDQVEGMGWQAFAAGRPLSSLDPAAFRELTSNPLLGQSYARLTEAYRTRAQSYASGAGRAKDNSPAYLGLLHVALTQPGQFTRQGWLESILADADSTQISGGDVARLLERRQSLQGGPNGGAVDLQSQAYGAVRNIAEAMLGDRFDLTPGDRRGREGDAARAASSAFNSALLQEVVPFVESQRRLPNALETQEMIGRAVVRLPRERVVAPLRVQESRGRREGFRALGEGVTPAAVVPFDLIPRDARREIVLRYQNTHGGRQPTVGYVEATYARFLASEAR